MATDSKKLSEKIVKEAQNDFSLYTVSLFDLGTTRPEIVKKKCSFDLKEEIDFLKQNRISVSRKKFDSLFWDSIVLCSRFNSVLGYDGFEQFKNKLSEYIVEDELKISFKEFQNICLYCGMILNFQDLSNEEAEKLIEAFDCRPMYRIVLIENSSDEISFEYEDVKNICAKFELAISKEQLGIFKKFQLLVSQTLWEFIEKESAPLDLDEIY